jgi:hypothetical protein
MGAREHVEAIGLMAGIRSWKWVHHSNEGWTSHLRTPAVEERDDYQPPRREATMAAAAATRVK